MSGSLKDGFAEAVTPEPKDLDISQKDYPKPISVRFSDEERSLKSQGHHALYPAKKGKAIACKLR